MYGTIFQRFFYSSFYIAITLFLSTLFSPSLLYAAEDDFPGRKLYPEVKTISIEDLYKKIKNDEVVVVDVRSAFEYRTLKVLNAIHIPNSRKSFPDRLKELRASTTKDIIFYCNGRTCYKSYNSAIKAIKYNVSNCYTFDAGIFEWALAHPELASLLDKSPVDTKKIISKDKFNAHRLSPKDFEQRSLADNSRIFDVRDREQRRGGSGLFMFRDKSLSLDNTKKLKKIVDNAIKNNTTLYFYDEKGKQVRWLQYSLEGMGLKKYYFMIGGAAAYYKMMRTEQGINK